MNHRKILGFVFVGWSALQIIAAAALWAAAPDPSPYLLMTFLAGAIYGWAAWRLLKSPQPAWLLATGLSAAAMFSFPIGTVIGAYGLWVGLGRSEQLGGSPFGRGLHRPV